MGSGTDCHESVGESESLLFSIAWGAEGRYLFCVWKWFRHFYVFVVISLFILVLNVCICGVHGGMNDTELGDRGRGEKMLLLGRVNRVAYNQVGMTSKVKAGRLL